VHVERSEPEAAPLLRPGDPPHRDGDGVVHVHDHATVHALLRDARRVTSDVSELLPPGHEAHPVSAFVWATDRLTVGGRPGRHPALRALMAPWFTPAGTAARGRSAAAEAERILAADRSGPLDAHDGYAMPLVAATHAAWLGIPPAAVEHAVRDQIAAGEFLAAWPLPSTAEADAHHRGLLARPDLDGVAAAARALVGAGRLTEREAWGIVYSLSVTAVATAAAITLAVGLGIEHGWWSRMDDPHVAGRVVEEAVRLGTPFPLATRFAREPFHLGPLAVRPGEQVLMWLTAANRDLPGAHRTPLDRFDPDRDTGSHLGWGSGYHRCAGAPHARAVSVSAVTALARLRPRLRLAGPWRRFLGVDDGYVTAPVLPSGGFAR
jgi:cytochrome P450